MDRMIDLVGLLKTKGVVFEAGLTASEVTKVEDLLGAPLPPDLKVFLSQALPVSSTDSEMQLPNWRNSPKSVIREAEGLIEDLFVFDIESNDYWHELLGSKPSDIKMAKEKALACIRTLPPLIPVYGHRYIFSSPKEKDNPVISFHGPLDTVYYGNNLEDYFHQEFKLTGAVEKPDVPKNIPIWGELLGLTQPTRRL